MIMMPYDWPQPSLQLTGQAAFWHPTGLRGAGRGRRHRGRCLRADHQRVFAQAV